MSSSSPEADDLSDSGSESSTIVYEHESFADFQPQGGGFNRIVGLSLARSRRKDRDSTDNAPGVGGGEGAGGATIEYILRIPRNDSAQVDADIAALLFVRRLSEVEHYESESPEIPAPPVIVFDLTGNDPIQSPYMVQSRLCGRSLIDVFSQLAHEQQRRVAQELGQAYNRMLAVSSVQAGRLVLPDNPKSLDAEVHVTAWDANVGILRHRDVPRKPATTTPYRAGRDGESILQLLTQTFQDQKAEIQERLPKDTFLPTRLDQFCNMTAELDASGYFKTFNGYCSLADLDLEPRNILVDIESSPNKKIVSGILDWDSPVLAPAIMSCTPPMWLWSWKEDEDEGERLANELPSTAEQKELKEVFEFAAGAYYVAAACPPAYWLARRLVRFAIHGIRAMEDDDEAEHMLAEWQSLNH